ncbi:major facilitator superfamily domain-containing protein [Xylariaceae sp. FL0594]|nr:major facilitator superfamily domain-containing protein [Xylariaceae sp. FL0594]
MVGGYNRRHAKDEQNDQHALNRNEIPDSSEQVSRGYEHGRSRAASSSCSSSAGALNLETGFPRTTESKADNEVKWKDLPRKDQLLVITLARLGEPLTQTSLQAYMFYQLQWFDLTLSAADILKEAGILHASFTAAQFVTAMFWGRIADSRLAGRKTVILIGLMGTLISALGFGFSRTFYQALFFRCLGGITNGNIGVMRTMISEIVREKKYQSRAFLILPMTFNIGVIIGPVLGGILSDPAGSYPSLFGNIAFFQKFPYATPNIVSAVFLGTAMLMCWLMLEETLDLLQDKRDMGIIFGRRLKSVLFSPSEMFRRRRKDSIAYYQLLHSRDTSAAGTPLDYELSSPATPRSSSSSDGNAAASATSTSPGSSRKKKKKKKTFFFFFLITRMEP